MSYETRLRDGTHTLKTNDRHGATYYVDSLTGTRVTLLRGALSLRREGKKDKTLTKVGQSYDVVGPPAWLEPLSPDNVVFTVLEI